MTDRFEFLEQIGKGGMGVVWKARDTQTGRIVAVKQLNPGFDDDAEFVQRFENEVEITRRVHSPNVVEVLGFGKQNGRPFLAMEFIDGESLREVFSRRGKIPWPEVRELGLQLANGLAAAHAQKVVHRDVKPSNILIGKDGVAKLADFGISRADDMTRMTRSSAMLGTPAYMAPDPDEDERSDLYSLGCILFEALAGVPPITGKNHHEVLQRHMSVIPDLATIPPEARPVIGWLLQKLPKNRPQSAVSLQAVLAGTATLPKGTQRLVVRPNAVRTRIFLSVAALIVVLSTSGIVAAFTMLDPGDREEPVAPTATPLNTSTMVATSTSIPTRTPTPTPTATQIPTSTPTPNPAIFRAGVKVAIINAGDCLNLRGSPSTTVPQLTCLPDGTEATILGGPAIAEGRRWWQVRVPAYRGRSWDGWVAEGTGTTRWLSPLNTPVPEQTSAVNLSGTWDFTDTVDYGPDQGQSFQFEIVLTEQNGVVTGQIGSLKLRGLRDGNRVRADFTRDGGSGYFDWQVIGNNYIAGTYADYGANNGGNSYGLRQ